MTIQISPQIEAKLREKALQEGRNLNETVETLLDFALEWEIQERAETIAGIKRGLDAFAQGKSRPFREFDTEMRNRHHLPPARENV